MWRYQILSKINQEVEDQINNQRLHESLQTYVFSFYPIQVNHILYLGKATHCGLILNISFYR